MAPAPEPMVIFSPELFSIQNYGGVTRCMIELMRALHRRGADWQVWAGRHISMPLEDLRAEPGVAPHVVAEPIARSAGRLRASTTNEWRFRRFVADRRDAVVHRSQYAVIDMLPADVATVSTLHDMWTERDGASPAERIRSRFKRRALERSDAIVSVSEHSRRALIATWPHLADRTVTIHHGVGPIAQNPVAVNAERPFFLFVGNRAGQKNCDVVLRAMAIADTLADATLLCVGGGAFSDEEDARITALGLAGRVHQRTVTDAELAGLYAAAIALLYPSRHEGFGLPLLEAMLYDCPVVSSPLSCLPEIGGDAPLYADADDPEAWRAAMERLALDSEAAQAARARGRRRVADFSWDETARRHEALYATLG